MEITKNWFYDLSKIAEENINISSSVFVCIYDDWKKDRKISLWKDVVLNYYSFLFEQENKKVDFFLEWNNSKLNASVLLFSENNNKIDYNINSKINSNNSEAFIRIISVLWENWNIDLDWIIDIQNWLIWIECELIEENIFLSSNASILAKPQLFVKSRDVKAKHSCKIEKVEKQKKFYIESRWINAKETEKLLLLWKIENLFDLWEETWTNIKNQILLEFGKMFIN